MRETRADTAQALLLSLALHALLFALAVLGLWWTRERAPVSAAGSPVEADFVSFEALPAQARRALAQPPRPPEPPAEDAAPPPQPRPEPAPQEAPVPPQPQPQERLPEPDTREQERVRADAISRETREREQEERRRQEQVDLTERERQEEAQRRQRLSEMERERLQQLADIRRRREQAAREARLAEERLRQLADYQARNAAEAAAQADASASAAPRGNEGLDRDLLARYQAALQEAIARNWTRPETVPLGQRCQLIIKQIPGGQVIEVQVAPSCPYDELGRRSVEAAVLKAQPLPYAGFERVFARVLTLNFEARDY
ncbi:cell envelope integrity protein TolA [Vulcaniibacterium gelatinicum]|uniref:cell envelope integrity protein TolA n=1 Tax=Vulcaniibacterium gelatinicum TaxID=2598725 RepID=UPI0011CB3EC2|nr:cell envelope integrity protein TolA [Vulcaniibacterium gelatinicum]